MKKKLLMTTVSISSIFLGGGYGDAMELSIVNSEAHVQLIAGDGSITPPIGPNDPDNPGTEQKGPLSIDYVSNLTFGQHKIAGKDSIYQVLNKEPFVQVTDLRGTGAGWSLSAKMTPFTNENKQILRGATLSMVNGTVKAASAENVSLLPKNSNIIFDNAESKVIMEATENSGLGTWILAWSGMNQKNDSIQLNVVAGTPEVHTEYTASIVWELNDAPK